MVELHTDELTGQPQPVSIDPFSFFVGTASRITGLGGNAPGHDPGYVFHTPYVQPARGLVTFTLRFTGLVAKRGTLVLRINMLPLEPGAHARMVNSERVTLNRVIAQGNEISMSFESFRGMSYAILGSIPDDTDARADALTITIDRLDDGADHRGALAEARSTIFRSDTIKPATRLISVERATLADPVSQMCTASQMAEPAYGEWLAKLRVAPHMHRKQWELVYILQVLQRYGMLQPGARGLGFGVGMESLPALMAQMGVSVVATDLPEGHAQSSAWHQTGQHVSAVEALRRPELCDDETFARNVSFRAVDMTQIPGDLVNFDFAWSACAYEHLGSIAAGLKFVEDSLQCLRPGGLVVHTTELNLTSNDDTVESGDTVLFRRRDMERLALKLISRGHEVAEIKLDMGDTPLDEHIDMPPFSSEPHLKVALGRYTATSFGIIARKALSPI